MVPYCLDKYIKNSANILLQISANLGISQGAVAICKKGLAATYKMTSALRRYVEKSTLVIGCEALHLLESISQDASVLGSHDASVLGNND